MRTNELDKEQESFCSLENPFPDKEAERDYCEWLNEMENGNG